MRYRTPIREALGPGSSGHGLGHWWMQRLTAIALIPLSLWFIVAMISLAGQGRAGVLQWLHAPLNAMVFSLFFIVSVYHAMLGLHKIIEDYVQLRWLQLSARIAISFTVVSMAFSVVFSLIGMAFGG